MSLETQQTTEPAPSSGVAIPGEAAPAPQPAEGGHDDTETRARAMGWAPKEEFRGDPERWVDAETFVKRGEEELPIVRERLRTMTHKLTDLERKIQARDQTYAQTVQTLERMNTLALERQRQQIEQAYSAAQRAAVDQADGVRYEQLERDKELALRQHDELVNRVRAPEYVQQQMPQQPQQMPIAPHDVAEIETWKATNRWFNADPEMTFSANVEHQRLLRDQPGLTVRENLARVREYVAKRFPDKFGVDSRASGPVTVEGGTRIANGGRQRSRGAADLPADARAQGERFIKQGLFKNINEYAAEYWSQDQ